MPNCIEAIFLKRFAVSSYQVGFLLACAAGFCYLTLVHFIIWTSRPRRRMKSSCFALVPFAFCQNASHKKRDLNLKTELIQKTVKTLVSQKSCLKPWYCPENKTEAILNARNNCEVVSVIFDLFAKVSQPTHDITTQVNLTLARRACYLSTLCWIPLPNWKDQEKLPIFPLHFDVSSSVFIKVVTAASFREKFVTSCRIISSWIDRYHNDSLNKLF